jgi:predicted GNAT family acetyltransferase
MLSPTTPPYRRGSAPSPVMPEASNRGWLDGGVEISVGESVERERFEARDEGGTLLGVLTYQLTGSIIAYTHTRVEPGHEGHGVGSILAKAAMDDAKAKGRTVVPICPFLSAWLEDHHEYDAILARKTRRIR